MPDISMKEVQFHDGEGLVYTDLNLLQRRMNALLLDGFGQYLLRVGETETGPASQAICGAIHNAGAPFAGVGSRESANREGLIFQRITSGTPSGDDPQLLAYYVEPAEYGQTHPAAGAGLQRWDLISVQLAFEDADAADQVARTFEDAATREVTTQNLVKARKAAATFTLTQGSEVASNPTVPATPANHVPVAAFRVYDGMTTFDPTTDIKDYRVPMANWSSPLTHGMQFGYNPSQWSPSSPGTLMADGSGAREAYAICPAIGGLGRVCLVGLGSYIWGGSAARAELMRLDLANSLQGISETLLSNLSISLLNAGGLAHWADYDVFGSLGDPLWTNGYAAGYAVEYAGGTPQTLALKVTSGSLPDQITGARWYLAG